MTDTDIQINDTDISANRYIGPTLYSSKVEVVTYLLPMSALDRVASHKVSSWMERICLCKMEVTSG